MKRFNLEEYKKDPSREITNQYNDEVRIICTDRNVSLYPIVALVKNRLTGKEEPYIYTANGFYTRSIPNMLDLYFAPKRIVRWQNIYKCCGKLFNGRLYKTEKSARKVKTPIFFRYVTTVKVEWEE